MGKTKKSIYNLIASLVQVFVAQIITLIVSRKVLEVYGSDINGVNAVFTNTLVWLMLIEGGFTFASSVALFKAFSKNDSHQVNRILSATKKALNKIGFLVGIGGVLLAFIAPFFIKTNLPYNLMLYMFLLMAFGTFFGLSFTRKYALMFSVKQEEYNKTYIGVFVAIVTNIGVYLIAINDLYYIWVRVAIAVGVVLTGLFTVLIVKRKYSYVDYNVDPDFDAIKGTRDMVFNKLASLLNSSLPLIYIASVIGAAYASVYAVYMIVFGFITKLNMMIANAVQNGFGQMIAERKPKEVFEKFRIFEFLLVFVPFTLISISTPVTMTFIKFYTRNVQDVNYTNWTYLFIFTGITIAKIIHIPSGIIMLMSGAFKKSRKIQINALIVLILGIVIGGFLFRVSGILTGIFVASLVLGIQEIVYTRSKYFKIGYENLFKTLIILGSVTFGLVFIELKFIPNELSFKEIVYYVVILSFINFAIMFAAGYIFFYDIMIEVRSILKRTIIKNKKIKK